MQNKIRIDIETGLYIETVHPSESGYDIISVECTGSYNLPRWIGTEWEEGGTPPEPEPQPQPQAQTMEEMAIALVQTQAELEATTEALDFLIMGGF